MWRGKHGDGIVGCGYVYLLLIGSHVHGANACVNITYRWPFVYVRGPSHNRVQLVCLTWVWARATPTNTTNANTHTTPRHMHHIDRLFPNVNACHPPVVLYMSVCGRGSCCTLVGTSLLCQQTMCKIASHSHVSIEGGESHGNLERV